MSVELKGAEQWGRLAKSLQGASRDLKRELSKEVTKATKPIKPAIQRSVREALPRHGGLNERVARSNFRTRRTQSGIQFQVRNAYTLKRIDQGRIRHPVFGRRVWVDQTVPSGSITRGFEEAAPGVRRAVQQAMDAVAKKIKA